MGLKSILKQRVILYDKYHSPTDITRIVKWYFIATLTIIILTASFVGTKTIVINKTKFIPQETKTLILRENNKFSERKLKAYLKQINIRFPDVVYAQAVLETNHFKSPIFKKNNNLFGMKWASSRPRTAIEIRNNHAYYSSWKQSVLDYSLYQAAFLNDIRKKEDYLKYIGHAYAEQPDYLNRVKNVLKRVKI